MAAINVADLTDGTVNGPGIFDKLMAAGSAHIQQEYAKSRIKGAEYSTVYLGMMQAAMQNALQFLLNQQKVDKEAQLLDQQIINAGKEGLVLDGQKCKLDAEFDVLMETKLKVIAETALLNQKKATEQAQITALGVDADSVIGKQKALYTAQADGFTRDAEQKAAKIMVDSWNVRRTTDEATVADGVNLLSDVNIGRAITKLLAGVNA